MNIVIYVLSGILMVLLTQLAVRSLRRKKRRSENIWHIPVRPSKKTSKRIKMVAQPQVPPPAYMFRQR